jgi:ribosomal protein L16 Arg81 hydroxylase
MQGFEDFLAPFDAGAFMRDYFGRRPIYISRGGRAKVFGWDRMNAALAIAPYWTEETLKIFYNNRAALRESYCDIDSSRAGPAPVNPAKVRALVGHGASVIANHVHRVCPELGDIARMLEKALAAKAGANVYCSFKDVRVFQTHYDLHDVFALQAEGEKVWNIYETRADAPVSAVPAGDETEKWLIASRGALMFQAHMKPGDILYLPRGQYHDAMTAADNSMHVTFWVQGATGLSLFSLLEAAAKRDGEFRADLPDARDEQALRARLARLADLLREMMLRPALAIEVLNLQRGLASTAPIYDLPAQSPSRHFQVMRKAQVVRRPEGFWAGFDGGEIELGATYPAVQWLLAQRHFSFADALARHPSVKAEELMPVLEQLTKAGVIVETELAH